MFVIITYDIEDKRINKVRKTLKKYLTWTQNSVFEGEITEGKLHKCLSEINKLIDKKTDSIYVYRVKISKNIKKDVIGIEKNFNELFL
ncbi:MAG: CRISPR-associated endonuclease Cas2 [Vallitalea sp.]|nr:CRISPR-associated endonuclease Cas2 [Vallitalea sp.]